MTENKINNLIQYDKSYIIDILHKSGIQQITEFNKHKPNYIYLYNTVSIKNNINMQYHFEIDMSKRPKYGYKGLSNSLVQYVESKILEILIQNPFKYIQYPIDANFINQKLIELYTQEIYKILQINKN